MIAQVWSVLVRGGYSFAAAALLRRAACCLLLAACGLLLVCCCCRSFRSSWSRHADILNFCCSVFQTCLTNSKFLTQTDIFLHFTKTLSILKATECNVMYLIYPPSVRLASSLPRCRSSRTLCTISETAARGFCRACDARFKNGRRDISTFR